MITGNFFSWTGSAHVMIITPFPTRPPPNWPHQLQTPSCGPEYGTFGKVLELHLYCSRRLSAGGTDVKYISDYTSDHPE